MKRDPFKAIVDAAKRGVGCHLSAMECEFMATQPCVPGTVGQAGVLWRTIEGFSRYEISERGDVRRDFRLLKLTESRSLHMKVTLYSDTGEQWRVGVHQLVALAFHGPAPEGKPFACHENGRAWENHKDNIYWGSREENTADMVRHASLKRGGESVESTNKAIHNADGTTVS